MKLLFVIDKLNMGGVSSSLLNILNALKDDVDCSLLIFSGETNNAKIPSNVNIINGASILKLLGQSQNEIMRESLVYGVYRFLLVMIAKVVSGRAARKLLFLFTKKIYGYDAAISFTHDVGWKNLTTGCNQFVVERVEAKHKISFVHCDYKQYGGYNPKQEIIYKSFDNIVCVSDSCKKVFIECFPNLESKCRSVANFTDVDKIAVSTKDYFRYDHRCLNIVTVCRITEEKGIDRALKALELLKSDGYKDFLFTIVGDGNEKENMEQLTSTLGLQNNVSFVGGTSNPFYYMKDADVFLSSSYHEAAPMVFGECKALGLPIIATETVSAKELVENKGAGIVCDNSVRGIYECLKRELVSSVARTSYCFPVDKVNYQPRKDIQMLLNEVNERINR